MNFKQDNKFLTNIFIYLTFFLLGIWFYYIFFDYKNNNLMLKKSEIDKNIDKHDLNLDKYFKVFKEIKQKYYDFSDVDLNSLEESSIIWLVSWLWDPYTEYFNKQENKDFIDSLSWDFEWIWAVLEKDDLWVKINYVIDNSPAKNWDLRINDIILEVNWVNIKWMSTTDVIKLIKWPSWKEVNLVIKRDSDTILDKKLFTWAIVIPSVSSKDLEWFIWYIWISTFWELTWKEFKEALEKYIDKKWIIIDLRQNWGWYLNIAKEILSNFIKENDVLLFTKYKNWKIDKHFSHWSKNYYKWKIVILVDNNSASASEIVAWAMKDYKKAILVWEKTYWKWSVQDPIDLLDWSMVKITTAKWFTPNDKNIDKEWIKPDIEIKITEKDIEKKYDRQLEEAKKVLKSFIDNNYLQLSIDKYKENNKN